MRIVIAGIRHESNSYCAATTPLSAFEVLRGEEVALAFRGTKTYVGGMLEGAREIGADALTVYLANAEPSGTIEREAYDLLRAEMLSRIAAALPADAVALALHGAALAEGIDDVEGDLCRAVRAIVGASVPVVVTLDLHCNLTQAMADEVDLMLGVHHYPHIDQDERGREAILHLPALVAGTLETSIQVLRVPMLIPTTETFRGPLAEVNELCWELEKRPGVIDVTFFHGFPYTDTPHVGAYVVATTDRDPELAVECARLVAQAAWDRRERLRPATQGADEALAEALAQERGPVVINETSDNPGAGGPGDGTHLLRALLARDLPRTCFGFLVDPEAAAQAHASGVGSTVHLRLGGRTDRLHGPPLEVDAYVKVLSDGRFERSAMGAGLRVDLGKMARLRIGNVDVIVGSKRAQTFDPEVFRLHGIAVERYRIVALKSSHHFRAGFSDIASAIVTADPPGLTTARLEVFERARTARPIWPLDADATLDAGAGPGG